MGQMLLAYSNIHKGMSSSRHAREQEIRLGDPVGLQSNHFVSVVNKECGYTIGTNASQATGDASRHEIRFSATDVAAPASRECSELIQYSNPWMDRDPLTFPFIPSLFSKR